MVLVLWITLIGVAVIAMIGFVWFANRRGRQGRKGAMVAGCIGAVVAALVGVGGIAGAAVTVNNDDPRPYIEKNYQRAAALDDKLGGRMYITTKTTDRVRQDISRKVKPASTYQDRGLTFLRYPEWLVTIAAHNGGAKIEVDSYDNGYRRHRDRLSGSSWPSTSTASGGSGTSGSGK